MTLALAYERCVRTRSLASSCRACVDACPAGAITLEGEKQSVAVALDACTDCGLCEAACPTEAFSGVFDTTALRVATHRVACGEGGVPCVGAISTEDLVALAQRTGQVELVGRACAGGMKGHAQAERAVAQANTFLAALGLRATLSWRDETPPPAPVVVTPPEAPAPTEPERPIPPRRQFIGLFVPRALPPKPVTRGRLAFPAKLDVKRLREAVAPARRARLLAALPSSVAPKVASLPEGALAFTSSKHLDAATCTGCVACVTACPTGALTSTRLVDQLRFDGSRCVKCHLCHDVCAPKAITLAPELALVDFLDFAPKVLVRLKMVQCGECGAPFKDDGRAQVLCDRCLGHDAEARELTGAR